MAKFTELACFRDNYVATYMARVRKFEDGLKLSIWGKIVGLLLQDMDSMVKITMAIERERLMTHGASGMRVLVLGRRVNPLPVARGRSRGLLLCKSFKDKAMATRAKARISHPKMGDTSRLQAIQGRERVSNATSLDTLDEISLRGRDPSVIGHYSPNHQWDMRRRSLFLFTPAWAKGTGISPRVLHKHLLFHRRATQARAWVEVEDKTLKSGLQGPRGVPTP